MPIKRKKRGAMSVKKILIVDDSASSVLQLKTLFSRTSCSVITANSGEEALKKVGAERPDLIIIDLYMPGKSGDECCRIIKGDDSLKKIPIIMFTVAKGEEERKKCLLAGCDEYLTKPLTDTDILLKIVKKYIDIPLRNHIRVSIDTLVRYFHEGETSSGSLRNISESGGFIETSNPLPVGSIISMSFTIPNSSNYVEVTGEIIRSIIKDHSNPSSRITSGMGMHFLRITWGGRKIISDYVRLQEKKRMTVM